MHHSENNLGGIPFAAALWNGNQILGWFFLFAILVIILALFNLKIVHILAIKYKWPPIFVGGILLSTFTSIPELVTGFLGGQLDLSSQYPEGAIFTLFNATGANAIEVFVIAILGIFLILWWMQHRQVLLHPKKWFAVDNNHNSSLKPKALKQNFNSTSQTYNYQNQAIYKTYDKFAFLNPFLKPKLTNFPPTNLVTNGVQTLSNCQEKTDFLKQFNQPLRHFYEPIWQSILHTNFILWFVTIGEYVLILLALYIPAFGQFFNVNGFSFLNFIFFFLWLSLSIYTFKFGKSNNQELYIPTMPKSFAWKMPRHWLLVIAFFSTFLFGFLAYLNSAVVDKWIEVFDIPESVDAGFILTLSSNIAELSLSAYLIYQKMFVAAVAGALGGSVFHLSINFWSNIISLKPLYGDNFEKMLAYHKVSNQIGPWIILSLVLYLLFGLGTSKKLSKHPLMSGFISGLIFIGYIVGFVFISMIHSVPVSH